MTTLARLRPYLLALPLLTLLTGVLYPLLLAPFALLFSQQANGSVVERDGTPVGSSLVAQDFRTPSYFHPRPSAVNYDAATSGGTNLSANGPKQRSDVVQLAADYRALNGVPPEVPVPADAVTHCGSGLDPHVSPANALLQSPRIALARGRTEESVRKLIEAHVQHPTLGILGDPRVNVLELNLALDKGMETGGRWSVEFPPAVRRWVEYAAFLLVVLLLARPVGGYLARVFGGQPTKADRVFGPVERLLLRILGVKPDAEMTAGGYVLAFVLFGLLGVAFLFVLFLLQHALPGGPDARYQTTPMTPDLAANTAVSLATTTTWQAYGGETTLKNAVQTVGLVSQGFLAGAAGLAAGMAFIRGFARENSGTLGNFWVDLVRGTLRVLLPAAVVVGAVLIWQGVPFTFAPYAEVTTLEGNSQTIARGPVAALEAIKNLGTNGGGFFAANGAHPLANPTPLANFVGLLAIVIIPAALPVTFGIMTGRRKAGWLLLGIMVLLFVGGLAACDAAEAGEPPYAAGLNVTGGNMEGKEVRFGVGGSVLAAVVTSNAATGSNNSMHGSFHPLGGLVLLVNLLLGEVVFGGLGSGLSGLVMAALVGVFLGGLMVGRTPEYLGKAIRVSEAKLVAVYALVTPLVVLSLAALAVSTADGRAGTGTNAGAWAFTEVLFAFASCQGNNGQAMGGLSANSPFYHAATAAAMIAGRFGLTTLSLLLAGRLAAQGRREPNIGSLSGDTPTFGVLILGAVLLVGALSFLPAVALGPLAAHLQPPG